MLVACIVALVGLACFLRLMATRSVKDIPVVVAAAVAWLAVNKPLEGPVLVSVTADHGLTVADVLSVPPLLLCALVAARAIRRRQAPAGSAPAGDRNRERSDRSV